MFEEGTHHDAGYAGGGQLLHAPQSIGMDDPAVFMLEICLGALGEILGDFDADHFRRADAAEDTAFGLAILAGLGTRSSVERSSFTAPRRVGGFQLASVAECAVGAVSSELMFLLNGSTLASDLARDSLQGAMLFPVDH